MKYLMLFLLTLLVACNTNPNPQQATNTTDTPQMNTKYPNIPLSEKGITVVNPGGWDQSQMDFHIDYCMQTVANLENIEPIKFCECFLDKVQYYYEPRFIKEAYADQKKWNAECYAVANKNPE